MTNITTNMNKYPRLFFRRIIKDLQQKELLPLKFLFFIHASTVFVIYPYLTIHMREMGINIEETAVMNAVTPLAVILMPPIAGLIADKIGNFKVLLATFSALGGGSALLLLLIPVGRITVTYPDRVVFGLSCNSDSPISLSLYQEHPCTSLQSDVYETNITIEACGFVCQALAESNDSQAILEAKSYGVQLHNLEANTTTTIRYEMKLKHRLGTEPSSSRVTHIALKNDEDYKISVRKLSTNSYFFPTLSLYNFSCGFDEKNDTSGSDAINSMDQRYSCLFTTKDQLKDLKGVLQYEFTFGIDPQKQDDDDIAENRQHYNITYLKRNSGIYSGGCSSGFPGRKEYISVNVPLYRKNASIPYKSVDLGSCASRCIATSPRKHVCTNEKSVIELDPQLTFWTYLAVRVFIGIISGTAFAMFEGAVIAILREHKGDYGLQRIYATIGGMISSPLSGWLIDFASRGKEYTDFTPIFFLYAALKLASSVLMLFMNLEFKTPATNVLTDVFAVLKKVELITLFIACFVLGTVWGYIESFLFWLIQDLGGNKSLMGITITVGGVAGIPLLVLSGPIIKRIGHAHVLFIGFIFYTIRLVGYSFIYDPWLCLIFEAMESITSSLAVTAAVTYAAKLSTPTTDTSIQGLLGGLYYGVGKGAGSLIGGFLMKAVGTRTTFQLFGVGSAVTGLMYFLFYQLYLKKRPSEGTDITKKDSIVPPAHNDFDLTSNRAVDHESTINNSALPFEDALTNLGYEDTEFNQQINQHTKTNNKTNGV